LENDPGTPLHIHWSESLSLCIQRRLYVTICDFILICAVGTSLPMPLSSAHGMRMLLMFPSAIHTAVRRPQEPNRTRLWLNEMQLEPNEIQLWRNRTTSKLSSTATIVLCIRCSRRFNSGAKTPSSGVTRSTRIIGGFRGWGWTEISNTRPQTKPFGMAVLATQ
jgi:hypothetical protein